jgi:hypothetical protein
VIIGYPKFGGGLGGYARYIAVCPSDWPYGVMISRTRHCRNRISPCITTPRLACGFGETTKTSDQRNQAARESCS